MGKLSSLINIWVIRTRVCPKSSKFLRQSCLPLTLLFIHCVNLVVYISYGDNGKPQFKWLPHCKVFNGRLLIKRANRTIPTTLRATPGQFIRFILCSFLELEGLETHGVCWAITLPRDCSDLRVPNFLHELPLPSQMSVIVQIAPVEQAYLPYHSAPRCHRTFHRVLQVAHACQSWLITQ